MTRPPVGPRGVAVGVLVLLAGAVVATLGLVAPHAAVAVTRVPFDSPPSDSEAVATLRAAYEAQRTVAYQAVAFESADGTWRRAAIAHVPGKGTYLMEGGSGDSGAELVESDASPDSDPLRLLRDHYALRSDGVDVYDGRWVWVLRAVRDNGATAARFWVDQASGLLVARAAYDDDGHPYDQLKLTDLRIGPVPHVAGRAATAGAATPTGQAGPGGQGQAEASAAGPAVPTGRAAALRAAGWRVPSTLPGGFELYDAEVSGGGEPVLHLSYSDGLCALSVFEQRGRLAAGALADWHAQRMHSRTVYVDDASPQRLTWQGKTHVFALITDAAPARVAAAVAALPHGSPADGVLDRLARGFGRLGSWLNPLR